MPHFTRLSTNSSVGGEIIVIARRLAGWRAKVMMALWTAAICAASMASLVLLMPANLSGPSAASCAIHTYLQTICLPLLTGWLPLLEIFAFQ
jgi:hypothetical protein